MSKRKEHELQKTCVKWFGYQYPNLFSVYCPPLIPSNKLNTLFICFFITFILKLILIKL